jgi:hypothetical protein
MWWYDVRIGIVRAVYTQKEKITQPTLWRRWTTASAIGGVGGLGQEVGTNEIRGSGRRAEAIGRRKRCGLRVRAVTGEPAADNLGCTGGASARLEEGTSRFRWSIRRGIELGSACSTSSDQHEQTVPPRVIKIPPLWNCD